MISRRPRVLLIVVLIVLCLGVVSASQAAVLTVTNTADDGSPGCLRWCIEHAQPGDEIQFDPSLDRQPIVLTNGTLVIRKDLTITGRGAAKTIVDGNAANTVLRNGGRFGPRWTVDISGVTIQNGRTGGEGGGGVQNWGRLFLTNCILRNNHAVSENYAAVGGGIASHGGETVVVLTTTLITGNTVSTGQADGWAWGGGVFVDRGSLLLDSSVVRGNVAHGGGAGGVALNEGGVSIQRSTISENEADLGIGGIEVYGGASVSLSSIHGNEGGGAIFHDGLSMRSSTVARNAGVGLALGPGSHSVADSTLVENASSGISVSPRGGSAVMRNTIVADNVGLQCAGRPPISEGHNVSSDFSCGLSMQGDKENTNPMLGPLQDNGGLTWTHAPLEGSPVIDRGWCDPGTDQRGVPRPLDGNRDGVWICDIGAVEYVPYEFEVVGPGGDVIVIPPDSE